MDFSQFVSRLTNPKRSANGVEARCPSHHDQANSLSVGWNEAAPKDINRLQSRMRTRCGLRGPRPYP